MPDSSRQSAPQPQGPDRMPLLLTALLYLAFAIYGSLVPLDFRPQSLAQAWENFTNIRYLDLGIGSRADWVANILLFIPLSFLWLGTLWRSGKPGNNTIAAAVVVSSCIMLSIAIEFTQQFFPPRTVSQNDILAESLGALIGVAVWWWRGPQLYQNAKQFFADHDSTLERLLWLYLIILFGYNVLPLDLTISPVEIYHKWQEGKLVLIPFSGGPGDAAQFIYNILTDIVIWIPVTLLWIMSGKKSPAQAWRWTIGAALVLEAMQLLVYSRVTDITDIITALVGATLGRVAARYFKSAPTAATSQGLSKNLYLGIAALALWSLVLAAVFWYPFDFQMDRNMLRQKVSGLAQVPFVNYYYGTEFRAVTEVIHKIGFFLPLGAILAYLVTQFHNRTLGRWLALALIAAVAAVLELGQVALPGKHPDNTDLVLMMLGGALGLWGGEFLRHRLGISGITLPTTAPATTPRQADPPTIRGKRPLMRPVVLTGAAVLVLALAAVYLPGVPYNVRELFGDGNIIINSLLLTAFLYSAFGLPVLLTVRFSHRPSQLAVQLPLSLIPAAALAWVCLFLAVPTESLHDVVGSPVLDWPWQWEILLRFIALLYLFSSGIVLATLIVLAPPVRFNALQNYLRIAPALPGLLLWVVVGHLVVVEYAATDNLTELMAGGGGFSASLFFSLWWLCLCYPATALSRQLATRSARGIRQGLLTLIISVPLAYVMVLVATEQHVVKYGETFSALQFLLSPDRDHLASGLALPLLYALAHLLGAALLVLAQYPFWRHRVLCGSGALLRQRSI